VIGDFLDTISLALYRTLNIYRYEICIPGHVYFQNKFVHLCAAKILHYYRFINLHICMKDFIGEFFFWIKG
jgi:hypothetical protein